MGERGTSVPRSGLGLRPEIELMHAPVAIAPPGETVGQDASPHTVTVTDKGSLVARAGCDVP